MKFPIRRAKIVCGIFGGTWMKTKTTIIRNGSFPVNVRLVVFVQDVQETVVGACGGQLILFRLELTIFSWILV